MCKLQTSKLDKSGVQVVRVDHKMMTHLEFNNLINKSPHGFRHGRSCLSNLLVFLDKDTRCIDDGDTVDAIYLDFAKIFDKVPRERLMQKIKGHGIGGKILAWIKCWLSERR